MGNCVTVHKSTNSSINLGVEIESPNNENSSKTEDNKIGGFSFRPQSSPSIQHEGGKFGFSGYEEDMFFDSYAYLESDCEDYFSVNGDTPSRGNTPVHPNSFMASPQLEKTIHVDTTRSTKPAPEPELEPQPSPTKQLFELFNESFSREQEESNKNPQDSAEVKPVCLDTPPKSVRKSPQEYSSYSSEATPYRRSYYRREKSEESAQCCIPGFVRSLSFSERKKRLSPNSIKGY